MEQVVYNDKNLKEEDIDIVHEKSRAFIVDSLDRVIVCEYNGAFMLPGGKKEKNETYRESLKRELKEELGLNFIDKEIIPFVKMIYYQKDYPTRDGNVVNRKLITNFYIINTENKIDKDKRNLTEKEKENFRHYYVNYHDIYKLLVLPTKNPRREFFDKELYRITLKYGCLPNIDLHTHTCFSDGELTKEGLIEEAKKNKINTLSICDHDGIGAFLKKGFTIDDDFTMIPGVEIGCQIGKGVLHILGYDYDRKSKDLNAFLRTVRDNHISNMIKINNSLYKEFGFNINDDKMNELIHNDQIGRVYLAKEIISLGYADSVKDAFDKYLKKAHQKVKSDLDEVTWKDAFKTIKLAGGFIVLAHPVSLKKDYYELNKLVAEMKDLGLDGIETYNQIYSKQDIAIFQKLAREYDLYQTIGSDFHGKGVKPMVRLSNGSIDNCKIKKLNFVEMIKKDINELERSMIYVSFF